MLEFDFPAVLGRLVDAQNELESRIALLSRAEGFAVVGDGVAKVAELALDGLERNGHWVGGSRVDLGCERGAGSIVTFDVPSGQMVALDDRRALRAVDFEAFRVAGMNRGRGLEYAGRTAGVGDDRIDHVLGLHPVSDTELPVGEEFADRAGEEQENVGGMDTLVDECAAALNGPCPFARAVVVGLRAVPFDVAVGLDDFPEAAVGDGFVQKQAAIVEAVLANDAQAQGGVAGKVDHLLSFVQR